MLAPSLLARRVLTRALLARVRVVALGALLSIACGTQPTLPTETFEPVRIGVITSLSGGLESLGPKWLNAAQLAAREVNAAGGPLPGRLVELIVVDDETDGANGERLALDLIETHGVVAIIGAPKSDVSLTSAPITGAAHIPQISCCSTSEELTEFNRGRPEEERYYFRTAPPDRLQASVLAQAAEDESCQRLGILHLDDRYGSPLSVSIEAFFEARGGTVVSTVAFVDERAQYRDEVIEIRDANPDCIALVGTPVSAGRIVRDWNDLSGTPTVHWLGTDGVRAPEFATEAGGAAAIDGFSGAAPITDPATPENSAFAERYRAVFGEDPDLFGSNQYDAMAVLLMAIAEAGSTDGEAIRDAIRRVSSPPTESGLVRAGGLIEALAAIRAGEQIDYQGASGSVDFDEFGDVVTDYEIWRFDASVGTNGTFVRDHVIIAEEIVR